MTCAADLQARVDAVYADCGGTTIGTLDWDTTVGAKLKEDAEECGCSGAEVAAPVFALAAAAMAFFA